MAGIIERIRQSIWGQTSENQREKENDWFVKLQRRAEERREEERKLKQQFAHLTVPEQEVVFANIRLQRADDILKESHAQEILQEINQRLLDGKGEITAERGINIKAIQKVDTPDCRSIFRMDGKLSGIDCSVTAVAHVEGFPWRITSEGLEIWGRNPAYYVNLYHSEFSDRPNQRLYVYDLNRMITFRDNAWLGQEAVEQAITSAFTEWLRHDPAIEFYNVPLTKLHRTSRRYYLGRTFSYDP